MSMNTERSVLHTSFLYKVLKSLKFLQGSKKYSNGAKICDIVNYFNENFCVVGDVYSQIQNALVIGEDYRFLRKTGDRFTLLGPAATLQLIPDECKDIEMDRIQSIFKPSWSDTEKTCKKKQPCQKREDKSKEDNFCVSNNNVQSSQESFSGPENKYKKKWGRSLSKKGYASSSEKSSRCALSSTGINSVKRKRKASPNLECTENTKSVRESISNILLSTLPSFKSFADKIQKTFIPSSKQKSCDCKNCALKDKTTQFSKEKCSLKVKEPHKYKRRRNKFTEKRKSVSHCLPKSHKDSKRKCSSFT